MSQPTVALISAMSRLLQDTESADMTAVCGDKEWSLHSLILAARSPFFKAAINNDTKERREKRIVIHDMDSAVLQQVINYMYGVQVKEGHFKALIDLLEASVRFQMEDLKKYVVSLAKRRITRKNVIELGHGSELYNNDELLQDCVDFIVKHDVRVDEELTPKFAKSILTSTQNALLKRKQDFKDYKEKMAGPYISLKAVSIGVEVDDINFKIRKTTKMGKLKKSYCDRVRVRCGNYRFLFEGRRISDDDTAEDLRMKQDDVIVVYRFF